MNFADDWILTSDLWYRKLPHYQMSHKCHKGKFLNSNLFLSQSHLFSSHHFYFLKMLANPNNLGEILENFKKKFQTLCFKASEP